MQSHVTPELLTTLERHLHQWKTAYHRGTPGVTYDDMAGAARRLLEMRAVYERENGRTVKTKVTPRAIASLLR